MRDERILVSYRARGQPHNRVVFEGRRAVDVGVAAAGCAVSRRLEDVACRVVYNHASRAPEARALARRLIHTGDRAVAGRDAENVAVVRAAVTRPATKRNVDMATLD